MANRDIITVGASAGGVETLMKLVGRLPKDLPASMAVKRCGGVAVVQDPEDAPFSDMPQNAFDAVERSRLMDGLPFSG